MKKIFSVLAIMLALMLAFASCGNTGIAQTTTDTAHTTTGDPANAQDEITVVFAGADGGTGENVSGSSAEKYEKLSEAQKAVIKSGLGRSNYYENSAFNGNKQFTVNGKTWTATYTGTASGELCNDTISFYYGADDILLDVCGDVVSWSITRGIEIDESIVLSRDECYEAARKYASENVEGFEAFRLTYEYDRTSNSRYPGYKFLFNKEVKGILTGENIYMEITNNGDIIKFSYDYKNMITEADLADHDVQSTRTALTKEAAEKYSNCKNVSAEIKSGYLYKFDDGSLFYEYKVKVTGTYANGKNLNETVYTYVFI